VGIQHPFLNGAEGVLAVHAAPEFAAPDTPLEILLLGEPRSARVLAEAVYDPGNERPRA
jgi:hypothetical protein